MTLPAARTVLLRSLFLGTIAAACADGPSTADRSESVELLRVGIAHLEDERPAEAARVFTRLAELAPAEAAGPANLAIAEAQRGNLAAARRAVDEAIARAPQSADVRVVAGHLEASAGESAAAIAHFEAAVELDSTHFAANWGLADLRDDIAALERIVASAPGNLPARARAARIYMEAGRFDEAIAHLEYVERLLPPGESDVRSQLRAAIDAGRSGTQGTATAAVRSMENLLRVDPTYVQGLRSVGLPPGGLPAEPFHAMAGTFPRPDTPRDSLALVEAGALPAGGASALGLDADGDGDEDLVMVVGGRLACLWNDAETDRLDDGCGSAVAVTELSRSADFDSDALADVLGRGPAGPIVLRSTGGGFEAWGAFPGGRSSGPLLALDADHDGDLDVLSGGEGPLRLLRQAAPGEFEDMSVESRVDGISDVSSLDFGDVDADGDLDVVAAGPSGASLLRNVRYGQFVVEPLALPGPVVRVGDVDHDGWFDIVAPGEPLPSVAVNDGAGNFPGPLRTDAVASREGTARFMLADINGDGHLDAIDAGAEGLRIYAGRGGEFAPPRVVSRRAVEWVVPRDVDGDRDPDLEIGNPSRAVRFVNQETVGSFFEVGLLALADGSGKVNRLGIGSRLDVWTNGTRQARVAGSELERFGLNGRRAPTVVRIEWTNGVPQSVIAPEPDARLTEIQVLKGSCGFLYVWNGESFEFVTDIMWKSALGMPLGIMAGEVLYAPPEPSLEYVRIPPGTLKARDGRLDLRITEELWEVGYLDELKLLAVDHRPGVEVYVNEAFARPSVPNHRIFAVDDRRPVENALDHDGRDVTDLLAARDFEFVGGFVPGPFQGTTRVHDLELTLPAAGDRPTRLFLAGWLFPTDASINVRIGQAGAGLVVPPTLGVPDGRGGWRELDVEFSFPTGKNKTVVVELPHGLPSADPRVRIRTSMEIYWDEAFYVVGTDAADVRRTVIEVEGASIAWRGFSRPFRRGGRYGPHWFDYDSVSQESPWRPLAGKYTRYGDVTELLGAADDRYVVFGPGDEISVSFPEPRLEAGMERTYFLYSDAFLKDADLNTLGGDAVEPLPYHGQASYPPPPRDTDELARFRAQYLTREVSVAPEHLTGSSAP